VVALALAGHRRAALLIHFVGGIKVEGIVRDVLFDGDGSVAVVRYVHHILQFERVEIHALQPAAVIGEEHEIVEAGDGVFNTYPALVAFLLKSVAVALVAVFLQRAGVDGDRTRRGQSWN
jgi:hypothetical protein